MNAVGVYLLPVSPPSMPRPYPKSCAIPRLRESWRLESIAGRRQPKLTRARGGGADLKPESVDVLPYSIDFTPTLIEAVSYGEYEAEGEGEGEGEAGGFPKRLVIVILFYNAFLLCNMDRVNMSITILPMSTKFNWSPTTIWLIQSSFFMGYLLTQDKANKFGVILSSTMLLRYGLGEEAVARRIKVVVLKTLDKWFQTGGIYSHGKVLVGCKRIGEEVMKYVDSQEIEVAVAGSM